MNTINNGLRQLTGQLDTDNMLEDRLSDVYSSAGCDGILTKRQKEILELIMAGNTNKQIAQRLYRSERTVEYHRNRLMRKLGAHSTVQLVKCAIAMGVY